MLGLRQSRFDVDDVLVIHMGGLGDVCLSESLFFSLREHFGNRLIALGNRKFLDLFGEYFKRTEGIESRHWLYLFSERLIGPVWKRIVFIGKDREGSIRRRWYSYSEEGLIFIDMYPDEAFERKVSVSFLEGVPSEGMHIEDYQLSKLSQQGIQPVKKKIAPRGGKRIIFYPEESLSKGKWPIDNFIAIFRLLQEQGADAVVLKPAGLSLPVERGLFIEDLADVKVFFRQGGIFLSNDSGMAHLAGTCGLTTVTVFSDFSPVFWRPRGQNISLSLGADEVDIRSLSLQITQLL